MGRKSGPTTPLCPWNLKDSPTARDDHATAYIFGEAKRETARACFPEAPLTVAVLSA